MNAVSSIQTGLDVRPRILIGLVEHLGDIVACEPVARYLKLNNPNCHLSWAVLPQFREIIDTNPFIDESISLECLTDWMKLSSHGSYDQIVDLHVNYRVCGHCQIPLVKRTGNPFVTAFEWFDYGALLEAFSVGAGLPRLSAQPRVYPGAKHAKAIDDLALPDAFCVIHRKSTDVNKDWTSEGWLALCEMIGNEFGLTIVEVGAGNVDRLPSPIDGVINLVNRLSILETAELTRRAKLFVGVDSGPAHLANASEIPGVVLLGKYGFFQQYSPFTGFYASQSPLVKIVRNRLGPATQIRSDEVLDAVTYAWHAATDTRRKRQRSNRPLTYPVTWAAPVEPESDLIARSGLFDVGWYAIHHPEVLTTTTHPIDHYIREGVKKCHVPGPALANDDFKADASDAGRNGNPLLNYRARKSGQRSLSAVPEPSPHVLTRIESQRRADTTRTVSSIVAESNTAAAPTYAAVASGFPKTFAFYLPQFHPIPENDWAHGPGFSEWHNVIKAKPLFRGHDQPRTPGELGFYDLRSQDVLRDQIRMAQDHGIDGFCFYYYYFHGRKLLHKPLENFVNSDIDAPFMCLWANENWTKRWDGGDHEVIIAQQHSDEDDLLAIRELATLFQDSRYTKIKGKPVLMIYKTHLFPDIQRSADLWRSEIVKLGFPGLYLVMVDDWTGDPIHPREIGFDASYEIPSNIVPEETLKEDTSDLDLSPDFTGRIVDYQKFARFHLGRPFPRYRRFRTVMLPWDNTPRYGSRAMVQVGGKSEIYRLWLLEALLDTYREYPEEERFVFIHSWNEWCEGTYLEPDLQRGRYFLEQTRMAIDLAHQAIGLTETHSPLDMATEFLKLQRAKDAGAFHVVASTRVQSHHVWRDLLHERNEGRWLREEANNLRKLLHASEQHERNRTRELDQEADRLRRLLHTSEQHERGERDKFQAELDRLRDQVDEAERTRRAIAESTIWRITQPLRKLIDAARKR